MSSLDEQTREWCEPGSGFDFELTGYKFGGAPIDDIETAQAILATVNQPCPKYIAVKALTILQTRTKNRPETGEDLSLKMDVFTQGLLDYPSDIVVAVCKTWAEQNTWFPSWFELKTLLDDRLRKRLRMQEAIQEFLAPSTTTQFRTLIGR